MLLLGIEPMECMDQLVFHPTIFIFICVCTLLFILYRWVTAKTVQSGGEILDRIHTKDKVVALTFDDGPNKHVPEILRMLDEGKIKATFFLVGEDIDTFPELARSILDMGHQIGNHSYSHKRMIFKWPQFIRLEVLKTDDAIRRIGYTEEIVFRPPYGKKLLYLPRHLGLLGKKTIMWNVNPDARLFLHTNPKRFAKHVVKYTKPGSIILLHPMNNTADRLAIPKIIQNLKQKGYQFVTVHELLKFRTP